MDIVEDQSPRDRMRAGDADRERVAEQLRSAHAEGRLDLAEYDERVQQAWAARTYGELDRVTADLPHLRPAPVPDDNLPAHRTGGHRRNSVSAWLSVSVINLVIWAIISLSTFSWIYPWWIWVAGPWGAVLLARWISSRAGGASPPRLR
jgi:hypothetical protein